jgi:hypothetical protein
MIYASATHMAKIAPIIHNSKQRYNDKPYDYKNCDRTYGKLNNFYLVGTIRQSKIKPKKKETSFISSSQSKFIGLNSTFDDEDDMFKAIMTNKLSHIKPIRCSSKSPSKKIAQVESKGKFTIKEESADISMEDQKIAFDDEPFQNEIIR